MTSFDETIEYRGFNIEIHQDEIPSNPYEAYDFHAPALFYSQGSGLVEYDKCDGIADFFDRVTPSWVSRHWRKIVAIFGYSLGYTQTEFDAICKERAKESGLTLGEARLFEFSEILDGENYGGRDDFFDLLEKLYTLAGYVCLSTSFCGYSQGDYIAAFAVSTPAHKKKCGFAKGKDETPLSLETDLSTYAAWAFGDVFGYTIDGIDDASVWGFYGDNFEQNGLLDYARPEIDAHIARLARAKQAKVKALIKDRAPLAVRARAVAQIAA